MFKKIITIALVLSFTLSLAGCMAGGGGTLDEVSKDAVVHIEDYLSDASVYFSLADTSKALASVKRDGVFDAYVDAAKSQKDLPEELVKSYVDSFKAGVEESVDDKALDETAKNLIKEELVVHLAYNTFEFDKITDQMRADMAKKLAAELGCDTAAIYTPGNDTYIVDTAIKGEMLEKYLLAEWDKDNGGNTFEISEIIEISEEEATVDPESSVAAESSEASAA